MTFPWPVIFHDFSMTVGTLKWMVSWAFCSSIFTMLFSSLKRIVRNEPNLDCFQHKYRRSYAENLGSLCFMVHKKIDTQTDEQTRRKHKHLFSPRKKALKTIDRWVVSYLYEISCFRFQIGDLETEMTPWKNFPLFVDGRERWWTNVFAPKYLQWINTREHSLFSSKNWWSFCVSGPFVWKSLPEDIRNPAMSLEHFKSMWKTHLFCLAFA